MLRVTSVATGRILFTAPYALRVCDAAYKRSMRMTRSIFKTQLQPLQNCKKFYKN